MVPSGCFLGNMTIRMPRTMIGVPTVTNRLGRSPRITNPMAKAISGCNEIMGTDREVPTMRMAVLCSTRATQ